MAHIHDKIDFCVEVFIVNGDAVLLRKHDKYQIWLSVGGHIELDEDPNEAALREVREEVGLDVVLWDSRKRPPTDDERWRELIVPVALGRHSAPIGSNPDHEHVTLVYFATSTSRDVRVSYDGDRSEEWHWFTKDELERNDAGIPDNVRAFALSALDELVP